jgi:hypothetical protein
MPLPGDDTLPETDDNPLFGSGFSFLKAPSAGGRESGGIKC